MRVKNSSIQDLPVEKLVAIGPNNMNPIMVAEFMRRLSAEPNYWLTPIRVRKLKCGHFRIMDGHHRFIAYLLCNRPVVRCFVDGSRDG